MEIIEKTPRQIKIRKYYEKNRDVILAKKKAQYSEKVGGNVRKQRERLTPEQALENRQRNTRNYYEKNRDSILAKKQAKYSESVNGNVRPQRTKGKAKAPALTVKPMREGESKVRKESTGGVNKLTLTTRNNIEDLILARELGISITELRAA